MDSAPSSSPAPSFRVHEGPPETDYESDSLLDYSSSASSFSLTESYESSGDTSGSSYSPSSSADFSGSLLGERWVRRVRDPDGAETFTIVEHNKLYKFRNELNKMAGRETFELLSEDLEKVLVSPFTCPKHLLPVQAYTPLLPGRSDKVRFYCDKCTSYPGKRSPIKRYIETYVQKKNMVSLDTKIMSEKSFKQEFLKALKYYIEASKKAEESISRNNERILDGNKKIAELEKKRACVKRELGIIMEKSGVPAQISNQKLRTRVLEILETFSRNYESTEIIKESRNMENEITKQRIRQKECVFRARLFRDVLLDFPKLNNNFSRFAYCRLLEMGEVKTNGVIVLREHPMTE